ncbi:MAG: GNAT family N-acetyltransferase [bacterium]
MHDTDGGAYPVVDLALARQLECADGMASANFVDVRREHHPQVGAQWINVGGTVAMFDGAASPLTQTFGLGLDESFTAGQLDEIEMFYRRHQCHVSHEICALAAAATSNHVSARGYSPIEASVVSVRPTDDRSRRDAGGITVRVVDDTGTDLWARVSGDGLRSESEELGTFVEEFGVLSGWVRGVHRFLAELDGRAIATAALTFSNGIAVFSGASTIPDARRQGAQGALLRARLAFAAEHNMKLAMIVASPGTESQRNAERQGFRPVYTRTKWQRLHKTV